VGVSDESGQEQDEAHRAIGRYVVVFSEMVKLMREMATEYVAKGIADMHVASLLIGEATAQPVANAFFGMCRYVGDLDEDETKVCSVLQKQVQAVIETRNDIAHGDWEIGSVMFWASGESRALPPRLLRILPKRSDGPYKQVEMTVETIDKLSDQVEERFSSLEEFGKLALRLPVFKREDGTSHVSVGEYRVRDVLAVIGGTKKGPPAAVARKGPHAATIIGGTYTSLSVDAKNRASASVQAPESA
jgi:hypothetical protein